MSHIIEKTCTITDMAALKLAAQKLGVQVKFNAMPRYYFNGGESKVCEIVLCLPGKYDLGIKRYNDGHYGFVCDSELLAGSYGAQSEGRKIVGDDGVNLMTAYGEAQVELLLMSQGLAFIRDVDPVTGDVRYTTSSPAEAGLLQGQAG